jgi:tetratricopeptide (TPR) repeat protein
MHDDHAIKSSDVEKGNNALKLDVFKQRLLSENVVSFFKSPEELRGQIIHSLVAYRKSETTIHPRFASDIPIPPEPYIPHPYTLLQTSDLVGRQSELQAITQWATNSATPVFNFIVAIGGMGKSALTWKWFNDIAPSVLPLSGRMWWSFYESDASFDNFVVRALAYVSRRSKEEVYNIPPFERELELLDFANRECFLFVLDGLERIMIAYSRFDAHRMEDEELDENTANYMIESASHDQYYQYKKQLRKTVDPRVGSFLRKLTKVKNSRFLVTSRLYPADLQTLTGQSVEGSTAFFLNGLSDEDAVLLWYGLGAKGKRDKLSMIFRSFNNYPLLIRALAGEVCRYHRSPCDYDQWEKSNPAFNAYKDLPFIQVKSHVFSHSMQGLTDSELKLMQLVASMKIPINYDALYSLLILQNGLYKDESELDDELSSLEDRGLLGWDRKSNRYDLHPIVRGIVWSRLSQSEKVKLYTQIDRYLSKILRTQSTAINDLDDLVVSIEKYNAMIGQEKYAEAWQFFSQNLLEIFFYMINAIQQQVEMLERLFPNGVENLPQVRNTKTQSLIIHTLALGYDLSGQSGKATRLYKQSIQLDENTGNIDDQVITLSALVDALTWTGKLREAELIAKQTLKINKDKHSRYREAATLRYLGVSLAARGIESESSQALWKSIDIFSALQQDEPEGLSQAYLAQKYYWMGDYERCMTTANRSWRLIQKQKVKRDFIRAARLQGFAYLGFGNLEEANLKLSYSLEHARAVNFIHEEIFSLLGLAKIYIQLSNMSEALEKLDEIWEIGYRGPYPIFLSDAHNILVDIHTRSGNIVAAKEAAISAYKYSWCDGPPYAYHWGLETAKQHLDKLGTVYPEMPQFDPSKQESKVEINLDELLNS